MAEESVTGFCGNAGDVLMMEKLRGNQTRDCMRANLAHACEIWPMMTEPRFIK